MAKSRAQRKADQKKREEQLQRRAREAQAKARGADPSAAGIDESIESSANPESDVPMRAAEVADTGPIDPVAESELIAEGAEPVKKSRREQRREEKERERRARESAERRQGTVAAPVKQRGAVSGFFASVYRELQRVQWPDRDTLIQASAVTLLFVAVAAAYLGALDAAFNQLIKFIL